MITTHSQPVARPCAAFALFLLLAVIDQPAFSAEFRVDWRDGQLVIAGATSSAGHAEILRDVVATLYPGTSADWQLIDGQTTPPGWSLVSEQALRTLALTRSGEAILTGNELQLRGVHDDPAGWQIAMGALERTLLPGMRLRNDVVVFDDRLSFAELCLQQFAAALRGRTVRFAHTRSDLSPAAQPLLDALVEIAADCPASHIIVTGHTDTSDAEAGISELSLHRAQAATDYLQHRGIAASRLSATGAGPSAQLDAANTRAARARNRRVEFRLLIGQ